MAVKLNLITGSCVKREFSFSALLFTFHLDVVVQNESNEVISCEVLNNAENELLPPVPCQHLAIDIGAGSTLSSESPTFFY